MLGRSTMLLTPTETGTHITLTFEHMTGLTTFARVAARLMSPMLKGKLVNDYTNLFTTMRQLILDDITSGKLNVETQAAS